MKIIGAHLSTAKGIGELQKEMNAIGADTCALFLKSPRCFKSSELKKDDIAKFKKNVRDPSILVPHGSYLINLANPEKIDASYECLIDDIGRCNELGITYYNLHPGSDTGKLGVAKAIDHLVKMLNKALEKVPNVVILIENMAGQGRTLGRTFAELGRIVKGVRDKERIGITLDTAHLFGAGYDIRTRDSFEKVMREFDDEVGMGYLRAMHLNDSKQDLGSRKDEHENLGKGKIGLEAFKYVMNSERFEDIPMILETRDPLSWRDEIAMLKGFVENKAQSAETKQELGKKRECEIAE